MGCERVYFSQIDLYGRFLHKDKLYMKVLVEGGYHDTINYEAVELKDGCDTDRFEEKTLVTPVVVTKISYTDGESNYVV